MNIFLKFPLAIIIYVAYQPTTHLSRSKKQYYHRRPDSNLGTRIQWRTRRCRLNRTRRYMHCRHWRFDHAHRLNLLPVCNDVSQSMQPILLFQLTNCEAQARPIGSYAPMRCIIVVSITNEGKMNCMTLGTICVRCGSGYVPVSSTGEPIVIVFIQCCPRGTLLGYRGNQWWCTITSAIVFRTDLF